MKYFALYVLLIHIKSSRTSFTSLAELLCLLSLCLTTLALSPAVSVFCSSLSLEVPQAKNSRFCSGNFILFLNMWLCFPALLACCSYTAGQLLSTSAVPQHPDTMLSAVTFSETTKRPFPDEICRMSLKNISCWLSWLSNVLNIPLFFSLWILVIFLHLLVLLFYVHRVSIWDPPYPIHAHFLLPLVRAA